MTSNQLHVGVVASPWLPVPPVGYGGTELVVNELCMGLQRAGHNVTLFTTGDSTCPVPRQWLFPFSDPDRMGASVLEVRHVAAAYDALSNVDIVHDHTLAGVFYRNRFPDLPMVTTCHGPFDEDLADLYGRLAREVPVIAISHDQAARAPAGMPIAGIIHHGIDVGEYPFVANPDDHILFLGRMCADKGVDVAVRVARQAKVPLLIAAKMREPNERRFFEAKVEPFLGTQVRYVGEADLATKIRLLSSARALINPISWPEPFGLVMIEALACGTPVVGYGAGAAAEILEHGVTGFVASDEAGLVRGLEKVDDIDRYRCRAIATERFHVERMVSEHVALYRSVIRNWKSGSLPVRPASRRVDLRTLIPHPV